MALQTELSLYAHRKCLILRQWIFFYLTIIIIIAR